MKKLGLMAAGILLGAGLIAYAASSSDSTKANAGDTACQAACQKSCDASSCDPADCCMPCCPADCAKGK